LDIEPGTVVANRYRIIHPLGRGGMGEVFAAENVRTGRTVAVKLLRADSKAKSSAVKRFEQEARAAGKINSDHVTQVLDVCEDDEHGIVIVFELLEGESLIDRLKRTGPIPIEELYPFIEQVWLGLADAHRAGIIHRDLKPSNVFLERRPDGHTRAKILDFGISKVPKEMGGETLTEMGQSLGTFSFMPPEQIGKAKTVDHRADIYACATLIYQALSGQLPYNARNILVMVDLKSKTDPRPLSEVMDKPVDPRLEAFLSRCLARNPDNRFQSVMEALAGWRELRPASLGGPQSTPSPSTLTPVPPPPSSSMPRGAPPPPSQKAPGLPQKPPGPPRPGVYSTTQPVAPGANSHYPGPPGLDPAAQDRRPRGGTIAMEGTYDSTAQTRAMPIQRPSTVSEPPQLRPVSPSVLRGMQDPRSAVAPPPSGIYQDPRGSQGQYGGQAGPGSYAPSSMQQQGPYSHGYPPPPSSGAYDESSKGPPDTSQTQPTRVYVPPNAGIQSGLNPSPAALMQQQQKHGSVSPGQMAPAPMPQQPSWQPPPPAPSSSLRIVLWFIVFAVVGFGIVALLHYLKMF
jgi:eukaryotic-like serine/threonine-protein kinase